MTRMDYFNRMCLAILNELYEAFPGKIDIKPDGMAIGVLDGQESYGALFDKLSISSDVVTFLQEEGFLRYESGNHDGNFHHVRLTMKGLALLGAERQSMQSPIEPPSLIARIRAHLHAGASGAPGKVAEEIVGVLFRRMLEG